MCSAGADSLSRTGSDREAWSFLFMQLSMWTAIPLPWKFLDFVAPGTLRGFGVSSGFERWGMCHAWSLRTQAVCQVPEANALPQAGGSICAFAPWAETPKHKLSQLYVLKQSARVWGARACIICRHFILRPTFCWGFRGEGPGRYE